MKGAPVPETAVNKYSDFCGDERDIYRTPGQRR
jgi:hypothetical protein